MNTEKEIMLKEDVSSDSTRSTNIGDTNSNLILVNTGNYNIDVYDGIVSNGAVFVAGGNKIGYIAPNERYSLGKRDGNTCYRKVVINVGGSTTKTGYITVKHTPWSGSEGYLDFMNDQRKVNSLRSSGDYVVPGDGSTPADYGTHARYITNKPVTIYDQSGNAFSVIPAGTHLLSDSSIAGETYPQRMAFKYKSSTGNQPWQNLCGSTWGWIDMISTGTMPSTWTLT